MVRSIPALNNRTARFPMLRIRLRSVRLASVKRSSTRPISASQDKTLAFTPNLRIAGKAGNISIPVTVNTIGAVTSVCSSRRETRLYRNKSETKIARHCQRFLPIAATRFPIEPGCTIKSRRLQARLRAECCTPPCIRSSTRFSLRRVSPGLTRATTCCPARVLRSMPRLR
jgi:hypothetical protein